ncbi:hypothetical protein RJ639_008520 [Escallonia herrerae]|uniref:Uncharacterized protein n=1 Tax=Escallonia herrerae TaxID=1293975 RepID=A0AA89AUU8_9ASTE|nr:hypothetical protein RJ639_008520 [Escallonia herrerae]
MGLRGGFPRGLEMCSSLTGLDLTSNALFGAIPSDISELIPFITTLDLSSNNISDEIPISIGNLLFLNVLKLENNRLEGHIPQEVVNEWKFAQNCQQYSTLRDAKPRGTTIHVLGALVKSVIHVLVYIPELEEPGTDHDDQLHALHIKPLHALHIKPLHALHIKPRSQLLDVRVRLNVCTCFSVIVVFLAHNQEFVFMIPTEVKHAEYVHLNKVVLDTKPDLSPMSNDNADGQRRGQMDDDVFGAGRRHHWPMPANNTAGRMTRTKTQIENRSASSQSLAKPLPFTLPFIVDAELKSSPFCGSFLFGCYKFVVLIRLNRIYLLEKFATRIQFAELEKATNDFSEANRIGKLAPCTRRRSQMGFENEITQFLVIACKCVQSSRDQRSSMFDVYNKVRTIAGERYGLISDSQMLMQNEIVAADGLDD